MNLTTNELTVLNTIARDLYQPVNGSRPESFDDTGAVWTESVAGDCPITGKAFSAVVGSLVSKGLVDSYRGRSSMSDGQDPSTLALTRAGYEAWDAAFPAPEPVAAPAAAPVFEKLDQRIGLLQTEHGPVLYIMDGDAEIRGTADELARRLAALDDAAAEVAADQRERAASVAAPARPAARYFNVTMVDEQGSPTCFQTLAPSLDEVLVDVLARVGRQQPSDAPTIRAFVFDTASRSLTELVVSGHALVPVACGAAQ